ncbi:peptidase inhibitor family I36 protein [Deinococcus sp.]|uniref:peptidase inhibitor family I36 protein n=1 Tax=Deinococcus sp. TaxID=47478 RepID=UPI003B5A4ABF
MKIHQTVLTLGFGLSLAACGASTPAPITAQDSANSGHISAAALTTGDAVCFYTDANYKGKSLCVAAPSNGQTRVTVPYVGNEFNDKISSLKIKNGLAVRLSDDANFCGTSIVNRGDNSDLSAGGFSWFNGANNGLNDKVSSVVVGASSDLTSFAGRSEVFCK